MKNINIVLRENPVIFIERLRHANDFARWMKGGRRGEVGVVHSHLRLIVGRGDRVDLNEAELTHGIE